MAKTPSIPLVRGTKNRSVLYRPGHRSVTRYPTACGGLLAVRHKPPQSPLSGGRRVGLCFTDRAIGLSRLRLFCHPCAGRGASSLCHFEASEKSSICNCERSAVISSYYYPSFRFTANWVRFIIFWYYQICRGQGGPCFSVGFSRYPTVRSHASRGCGIRFMTDTPQSPFSGGGRKCASLLVGV